MLNKYVKKKWVDALRSDKYTQTFQVMKAQKNGSDCFCALGVLCDIMDPDKWNKDEYGMNYWGEDPSVLIQKEILNSIGLTRDDMRNVWALNDSSENYGPVVKFVRDYL